MTADVYIQSVMDRVPEGMPLRDQIGNRPSVVETCACPPPLAPSG